MKNDLARNEGAFINNRLGNDSIELVPIHQTKIAGHGNKRDAVLFHTSALPPIFIPSASTFIGLILISFDFHMIHPS